MIWVDLYIIVVVRGSDARHKRDQLVTLTLTWEGKLTKVGSALRHHSTIPQSSNIGTYLPNLTSDMCNHVACMRLCRLSVQHFLTVRNIASLLVCKLFNQEMDILD